MSKKATQHSELKESKTKLQEVFSNLTPNIHLLRLSVLRQLNNKRCGTASTKTRAEVRGGGRKPWRQKGTGRARAGSIRSPLWVGGGISFGPKPRSYKFDIPQKARSIALAQAISAKANDVVVLKGLPEATNGKTKNFKAQIESLGLVKMPLLLICSASDAHYSEVKRASANMPQVMFRDQMCVGTFEILKADTVLITEMALEELEKRLSAFLKKTKGANVA